MSDFDFEIVLEDFNEGLSPVAHLDSKTFIGNKGQASEMKADVISNPGILTQSPALADLTNGSQAGVVDQLIRHILNHPVDAAQSITYGIGTTKLFRINATTVVSGGSPSFPQVITNMTEGESVMRLKANVYGFFNKSSGGEIFKMPISSEVIDHTWGSVTDQALEKAPHPSAKKEDIMVFGNGRYLGIFVEGLAVLDVQKLDFGEGAEVVDVVFHANNWWIAVNSGGVGQIYMYDGSAISTILSDEAGLGDQTIGFLYVLNGVIYVAYDDASSVGFNIGYLSGRILRPLRYFSGTLPSHRQKTLYKNTILFASSGDIWSVGAPVEQLPIQMSKLADGGHATLGAVAAPFGTPLIASDDGGGNTRLAKFSDFSTDSEFKSVFSDITADRRIGKITMVIVYTKSLGANARGDLTLEGNQGAKTSAVMQIEGENKLYHRFKVRDFPRVQDVRAVVDYANGDATDDCPIRKISLLGMFIEE